MCKFANPGELRTPVAFKHTVRSTDGMGFPVEEERNVFGEGREVRVKWVNAHGLPGILQGADAQGSKGIRGLLLP